MNIYNVKKKCIYIYLYNEEKYIYEIYCLNWKIYCDDYSSLSSTTAIQIKY